MLFQVGKLQMWEHWDMIHYIRFAHFWICAAELSAKAAHQKLTYPMTNFHVGVRDA